MKVVNKEAFVLCWCDNDMTSDNGIKYPKKGVVEDPNWRPSPVPWLYLYGHLWGSGISNRTYLSKSKKWVVVRVDKYADLGGYVTFPRAEVVFVGSLKKATDKLASLGARFGIEGATVIAPDFRKVIVGNYGYASTGEYGIAAAGAKGHAEAGDCSSAYAGKEGTAESGDYGLSIVGHFGIARAGKEGIIAIHFHDGFRMRLAVGYVGEDGIEPGTFYQVSNDKLVPIKKR